MCAGAEAGRVRFSAVSLDQSLRGAVAACERLDLKLSAADKQLLAQGAAIEGLSELS